MKKIFVVLTVMAFFITFADSAFAAEAQKQAGKAMVNAPAGKVPAGPDGTKPVPRPNFNMVFGTVSKIDTSDAANVKLEIKSAADDKMQTVSVVPWTNITKVTDMSELKTGDNVRVMSRKVDDKDVAMAVMFGKIQNRPTARPAGPGAIPAAPAQGTVKK